MQFCSFLKLFVRLFFIFLCALGARNIVDSQKSFIERSSGKHKKLIVTSSTPGTWIIGGSCSNLRLLIMQYFILQTSFSALNKAYY